MTEKFGPTHPAEDLHALIDRLLFAEALYIGRYLKRIFISTGMIKIKAVTPLASGAASGVQAGRRVSRLRSACRRCWPLGESAGADRPYGPPHVRPRARLSP
jgi:hypothetical protein